MLRWDRRAKVLWVGRHFRVRWIPSSLRTAISEVLLSVIPYGFDRNVACVWTFLWLGFEINWFRRS